MFEDVKNGWSVDLGGDRLASKCFYCNFMVNWFIRRKQGATFVISQPFQKCALFFEWCFIQENLFWFYCWLRQIKRAEQLVLTIPLCAFDSVAGRLLYLSVFIFALN